MKSLFIRYGKLGLKWILGLFLLFLAAGATLPFLRHKSVKSMTSEDVDLASFLGDGSGGVRARYIRNNSEALICRLRMLESARREILFSTFDFNDDEAGLDIMAVLLHAADRGIRVKAVVDGISAAMDFTGSSYFRAFTAHPNVEIKAYAPLRLWKPWEWQTRLHDKYIIVDEQMYILGGRNTTNLFLGDYADHQNFDGDLLVCREPGSAEQSLTQLQQYFSCVWSLPCCQDYVYEKDNQKLRRARAELAERYEALPIRYPSAFQRVNWEEETIAVNKVTLLRNPIEPQNKEPILWFQLSRLLRQGRDILIQTPYIICNKSMYGSLAALTEQGADVSIVTNDPNSGANVLGTSDYRLEKKRILKTGARLYEFSGGQSSHTKIFLMDERISVVGSFNLDMRSVYLDTELMLVVDCLELNTQLRGHTHEVMEQSKELCADGSYEYGPRYQTPGTGPVQRGLSMLLGILIRPLRYLL